MNTALNPQRTSPKLPRRRRLGLWYRAGWRFNYLLLGAYGPAQLGGDGQPDPRVLMRLERAERERALDAGARSRRGTGGRHRRLQRRNRTTRAHLGPTGGTTERSD